MAKSKIWGYVRVSTMKQSIERQIRNIKAVYPEAVIVTDEYTGTKLDRPGWSKVYKAAKAGDVIVFDEVSRMSRNAVEGFEVYQELFNRGVTLVFIKEPQINTETYKAALDKQIDEVKTGDAAMDKCMAAIMGALNQYMMDLAERQIKLAFEQSQKEVDDLHQRTREGIETARLNGKQIGNVNGSTLEIKKRKPIMALIREYSKDFDGTLGDAEVIAILKTKKIRVETGRTVYKRDNDGNELRDAKGNKIRIPEVREISAKVSRNTYYRYKRQLREGV